MSDKFVKTGVYNEVYAKIFKFHRKHADTLSDDEWENAILDAKQFTSPFEFRLIVAVMAEIERSYQIKRYGDNFESELLKLEQEFNNDVYRLISEKYN